MNAKKILGIALLSTCIASMPLQAFAEKVLFFTPTRVEVNDQDKVEVMNVSNLSDITRAYKISFQDLIMTPDGITTPVDGFDYSAKRMLRFVPREFVLKPGERQTVRVMSRLAKDTAEGEYHTHIRFLEDIKKREELNPVPEGEGAQMAAPLAYEALIPAIISHGKINTQVDIKNPTLSKNPNTNKWVADMTVTRTGNGQGTLYIDTHHIAANGTETMLTPRRTVYIYRELNERSKTIEFTLPENVTASGNVRLTAYDNPEKGAKPVRVLDIPFK